MTNRDVIDEDWQPRHEAIRQKVEELCRKHADHPHISKLDPNGTAHVLSIDSF